MQASNLLIGSTGCIGLLLRVSPLTGLVGDRRYGARMAVSGGVVARRLPVLGNVNAGKASTLAMMGAELDRVRAGVWARFSGAKTAHLSKRQIRDRLMAENAPSAVSVPQRLWRATVEDTVDKIHGNRR